MFPVFMRAATAAMLLAASTLAMAASTAELQKEVTDTERAFAKTMADRDHAAFASFLSPETIFFSRAKVLHGKEEVAAAWKRFYEGNAAPFSWEPDQVEVLASGELALSTGPVRDAQGKQIGRFNSIWRRDTAGTWRIVFDKGDSPCECAKP
jgi:ketosteroid isomerase-like protein